MKKTLISTMIVAALLFSQSLQAENNTQASLTEEVTLSSTETTQSEQLEESVIETPDVKSNFFSEGAVAEAETEGATETAKAVHEATTKSKRKNWSHVLLAAGAVAVAVVVLILVSNHAGHTSHSHQ